jgi:hypothetical protein
MVHSILLKLQEILSGFFLYSVLFICLLLAFKSKRDRIIQFDHAAKKTVAILGLIYILLFPIYYFVEIGNLISRNPVIYKYFQLTPFVLILFTQLFWFKKLNKNWIVRIFLMVVLSFSIEKYVIFVTSLHRDYLPATWSMHHYQDILYPTLFKLFQFLVCSLILVGIENFFKNYILKSK